MHTGDALVEWPLPHCTLKWCYKGNHLFLTLLSTVVWITLEHFHFQSSECFCLCCQYVIEVPFLKSFSSDDSAVNPKFVKYCPDCCPSTMISQPMSSLDLSKWLLGFTEVLLNWLPDFLGWIAKKSLAK